MLLTQDERTSRARAVLERRAIIADDLLPPVIRDSWSRCLAAGLDPHHPPEVAVADAASLRAARDRHQPLRRLALAEMAALHDQIAGTNFIIALAAPDGMLLDITGDASFGATAQATTLRPGSLWAEARCGTNAMGTAAQLGRRVIVHGGEHFFARYGGLTCTAAPILAPDGRIAGILDASSDCRSRQQHTQALVTMAATQIENGLLRHQHRHDLLLAFHSRGEYLHTLTAGLIALAADGRILAANAQARFLLQGLPLAQGCPFEDIFRGSFARLVDHCRSGTPVRLEDRVGSGFLAALEHPGPAAVALAAPLPARAAGPAPAFIAADPAVAALVHQTEAAARRRLPILIRGETGTGKEQMARHAHASAGRRGRFVPVNCAALPDSLAEAELFGHADGAFTGARRGGAAGLVVEADGGTLFLDEIGDMPLALQAMLLRLLDDWTVRPVGGGRTRTVDILLVAATNADLPAAVAAGRFRADLYFRLNTVEIELPPLNRRGDFAAIAGHLLATIDAGAALAPAAIARLQQASWPGNIRQLRSVLTRLSLARPGGRFDEAAVAAVVPGPDPVPAASGGLRQTQIRQVLAAHRDCAGNISETARRLGVSRNTVYRALSNRDPA